MQQPQIVNNIFDTSFDFTEKALEIMRYQYLSNKVYHQWNDVLHTDIALVNSLLNIPFLPISFFKTHNVVSGDFNTEAVFESSGTTQTFTSRHSIKDLNLYRQSFLKAFELFYGKVTDYCIIGLLPSYLERNNSSLVVMVNDLIKESGHPLNGFYLYDFEKLKEVLTTLEMSHQKSILIGVTFALIDFSLYFPMQLKHTIVMETGGMKGRGKELIRSEMHELLCKNLGIKNVHSEYGMTELLSQAYSKADGRFFCPPWMKVLIRDEEDPLSLQLSGKGILNVIDLVNVHSCSFIATDDAGIVYPDGSFEILGRIDYSDIRGCSLLSL